ncbi:hypothetical protein [Nocardioides dilutus]
MILRHLRNNAVAYLALAVALTTGTASAATEIANGSVTAKKLAKNSVTAPKIKTNAVRSADVKDGSLSAADIAPGVVPLASWVGGKTFLPGDDPASSPDAPGINAQVFTLPRAGRLQVTLLSAGMTATCNAGDPYVGVYVDGTPVPGTRVQLGSLAPVFAIGVIAASAGTHSVSYGLDCPSGAFSGFDTVPSAYGLVLAD